MGIRSPGASWVLTAESFERLLSALDPDRQSAAQLYESIRGRLIVFFEGRGCLYPAEYADETINRVARIIDQGRNVTDLNGYYFLGVARNVLKEYWKKQARARPIDDAQLTVSPLHDDDEASEALARCVDHCLESLNSVERTFIIRYYTGERSTKIKGRRDLAESLGLTNRQLRRRAFSIRQTIKSCAETCLQGSRSEANESAS